ncbi:hypothetical protein NPIL_468581 [Nephila pilipes]|uniref:Uncharacterized protein n=1 Tax=Nephila pilipes TaxID=299642 RepID=A0A8X6QDR6_NEPPI|nr:hypothetical protein NPIL_468581 [Nephila pilipes]
MPHAIEWNERQSEGGTSGEYDGQDTTSILEFQSKFSLVLLHENAWLRMAEHCYATMSLCRVSARITAVSPLGLWSYTSIAIDSNLPGLFSSILEAHNNYTI